MLVGEKVPFSRISSGLREIVVFEEAFLFVKMLFCLSGNDTVGSVPGH